MHVVAVRSDVVEENPWLPAAAFQMYSEAKQITYDNLESSTVLRTTLPWATDEYEETVRLMGKDFWRYGIDANRKELELVMRYMYEQGLMKSRVNYAELFHPIRLICRVENNTIPLPPDRDSSHRPTVESPQTKHLAGVV